MSKGLLLDTVSANNIITEVPPGKIWLFAQREGAKNTPRLRGKLSDGSFITFDVTTKYETVTETIYKATEFYQCASADTAAGTWTGYKWEYDEVAGIYTLSSYLTTDELTITGFVPLVGSSYSANTLVAANKLYEGRLPIPVGGLVFYASLAEDTLSADTGETMTEIGDVTHTVIANVPCAKMSGNSGAYRITGLSLPHGNSARTISYWVNFIDFDSSRNVVWGYGTGYNYKFLDSVFSAIQYKNGGSYDGGYNDNATVDYPFEAGKWYSIILTTADGKTFSLYVNGGLAGSMTHSYNGLPQSGSTLCLGKTGRYINDSDYWSTVGMNGYLAGFRFYDRVLAGYDIRALASEFTPTA